MNAEAHHDPQPTLPPEVIQHYAATIIGYMEGQLRETIAFIEDDTRPVELRRSYVAQTIMLLTETLQANYPTATHIDGIDLMLETFTLMFLHSGTKLTTGMGKANLLALLTPPKL